jgi:uncharacterized membrane protein YraQ (UPF0718 family)/copper chaperone CopZ
MGVAAEIAVDVWQTLSAMSPYLLFGFAVAGALSVWVSPETVEEHLGEGGVAPVFKAALFGIPLPLCSCGVIPVTASLRRHGASRGAAAAFLISTPQTGVDSILVTYSLLGPVFAILRPIAALVSGVAGGLLIQALQPNGERARPSAPACQDECCRPSKGGNRLARALRYGFLTLPQDIGTALLIGLLAAGLISALIPSDFFAGMLGAGWGAMFLMMALGIPVYVCATASVPIAAALMVKGVSPGAALVFLMTGPATNAAALATIWKVLGHRATISYLLTVALTALVSGFLLDAVAGPQLLEHVHQSHAMLPGWFESGSAVVLLAVLGVAVATARRGEHHAAPAVEQGAATAFDIKGMTCHHCAETVRRVIAEVPGVTMVDVDLHHGRARVAGVPLDAAAIIQAVGDVGYTASLPTDTTSPA